jgi:hypothetical protein
MSAPAKKLIAQFVRVSMNAKLGPMACTTYPSFTCPPSCPLIEFDCYVKTGFYTRLNWAKLDAGERGQQLAEVYRQVKRLPRGSLIRDKVAGDEWPSATNPELIDKAAILDKARAFKHLRVISYTHYRPTAANVRILKAAKAAGLPINLSADNLKDADKKAATGLAVAVVVSSDTPKVSYTPKGRKVVICPAQTSDRVTCSSCGLCADHDRDYLIGFRAHGGGKKRIDARLGAAA